MNLVKEMRNLNNNIQSEQLNHNARIPEFRINPLIVFHKANSNVLKTIVLPIIVGLSLTGCSEFAILTSGAGIVASNSVYAKTYNGVDLLTTIKTDKSLKQHALETTKKSIKKSKELKQIAKEKLKIEKELEHLKIERRYITMINDLPDFMREFDTSVDFGFTLCQVVLLKANQHLLLMQKH